MYVKVQELFSKADRPADGEVDDSTKAEDATTCGEIGACSPDTKKTTNKLGKADQKG